MTFSPEAQHNPNDYARHAIDLAKMVRDTPQYAFLRGHHMPHPEAFQHAAETLASEDTLDKKDRSLLLTTAQLGGYVETKYQLDRMQQDKEDGHYFPEDEWDKLNALKDEYAIPFNHQLVEYVATHPNEGLHAAGVGLATAQQVIFGRYQTIDANHLVFDGKPTASDVLRYIEEALDGMRHEVAAPALLEAAGYPFRNKLSVYADATGTDLLVQLSSGDWVGIDIKASMAAVQRARRKHPLSHAVWTQLERRDFTGQHGTGHDMLSVPYAIIKRKARDFVSSIEATARYSRTHQQTLARHVVHQTVSRH